MSDAYGQSERPLSGLRPDAAVQHAYRVPDFCVDGFAALSAKPEAAFFMAGVDAADGTQASCRTGHRACSTYVGLG